MFQANRPDVPYRTILAEITHMIPNFARKEVIKINLFWLHQELMPKRSHSGAREKIRQAFDRQSFRWVEYFALGADGLCYANLIVSFDPEAHARRLRIHPRVAPSRAWVDQIAPQLRIAVEQFKELEKRCELYVVARMKVQPELFEDTDAEEESTSSPKVTRMKPQTGSFKSMDSEPLPPIIWAPGRMHNVSEEISGLEELRAGLTFSENLSPPTK
jgi:hypothetical protein